jgi:hypothetical protein
MRFGDGTHLCKLRDGPGRHPFGYNPVQVAAALLDARNLPCNFLPPNQEHAGWTVLRNMLIELINEDRRNSVESHRETEAHFTAAGLSSQRNQSKSFRFKRAAFYQGLKSKVGLATAKATALRINLNVQDCSIVAAPAIMAIPYTGIFVAAICNSRFSHGRYTRSYGTVSSIGLLGQNCKPYMVVHYTFSIHSFFNQTMATSDS